jgi:hypothetical protein
MTPRYTLAMHQKTRRLQASGFSLYPVVGLPSEHNNLLRLPGSVGRLDGDPDDVLGSMHCFDHHDTAGGGDTIDDRLPARWQCLWHTTTLVQRYLALGASTHNYGLRYLIMMRLGTCWTREGWGWSLVVLRGG